MSCIHAIATDTEHIRAAIKKKQIGQSSVFDLQKAFDTLNPETLLQKMENSGFGAKLQP